MLENKEIVVDEMKFILHPLPAMRAMKLDKRVLTMLVPIFGGLKDVSLESVIDFEALSKGLSEALQSLSDKEFEILIMDLLSTTVYLSPNAAPAQIDSVQVFDSIFQGRMLTLYKLLFEIMRFNKFSPFAVLGDGSGIRKIFSSFGQTKSPKGSGKESAPSANLLGV